MQFDKDMNSNQAELFLEIQDFVITQIENYTLKARAKYSPNITSYFSTEFDSGFCYIRTKDDYVHIGWFRGSKIQDDANFLFGNGKMIRGQKIKILDKNQKDAIESYVEQTYILLVENQEKKILKCKRKQRKNDE